MCGKRRFGEHHDGQIVLKKPRRLSFEYESRGFPEIQIPYTATGSWPSNAVSQIQFPMGC